MARSAKFEIWGGKGKWFWHVVAQNGRIVCDGSERYYSKAKAVHGARIAAKVLYAWVASQAKPMVGRPKRK